jgi:hypothetical protein
LVSIVDARQAASEWQKTLSALEVDATVYALDSTTIDLSLGLFEWAPFESTKAARVNTCGFRNVNIGQKRPIHAVRIFDIP